MKHNFFKHLSRLLLIVVAVTAVGCKSPKNVTYFQDLQTGSIPIPAANPIKIRPGDKISIVVSTPDPTLSALFNLPINGNRITQGGAQSAQVARYRAYEGTAAGMSYYTVTPQGEIDFPMLGMLKIEGMTRSELCGYIKGELMGRNLVKDPTVTVEFLNVGVNVMGEVRMPGRYDVNTDDLTIVDVISLAGDINLTGRADKVLVMRKNGDKLDTYRVDMTNAAELVKSPAYYLQQDDVVYVEPTEVRKRQATINGNTALSAGFWVSIASVLTSICVLIFK